MLLLTIIFCSILQTFAAKINRHAIVSRYNPTRNVSSTTTPMQVGNGNFAFGADITGLQTFQPFAILSSWGWKNDSFPPGVTMNDILNWNGTLLDTHGRLVEYGFSPSTDQVGNWLISNPNRVNLGRISLLFLSPSGTPLQNITESDLTHKAQTLDLWSGTLTSSFQFQNTPVTVQTACSHDSDTVSVSVESELVAQGRLGIVFDFPWNDGSQKFEAPFVGSFDNASLHTTKLTRNGATGAEVQHMLGGSTFFTSVAWAGKAILSRDTPSAHRYSLKPSKSRTTTLSLTATYSLQSHSSLHLPTVPQVIQSSQTWWANYWNTGGFIDMVSGTHTPEANELQRRVILSQYIEAVNEAGDFPPQESGLVNNGWYGKFHLEMVFWHMAHWSTWSKQSLINPTLTVYTRFLPTSLSRAQSQQDYAAGARWGKMSDPSGRSAPGEINNLLIWQQPHPIVFAELEYRNAGTDTKERRAVLEKWDQIVQETADFMVAYAWWNVSTGVYDLGPPMYPVSENTDPLSTVNPTFELAYWNLGLTLATKWMVRQNKAANPAWTHVASNLAPLPTDEEGNYLISSNLDSSMWDNPALTSDHPAFLGISGWLPPNSSLVSPTVLSRTYTKVLSTWNISDSYGWDFPLLAMTSARAMRNNTAAVEWLLHELFAFDEVGMPLGGSRVATPYLPACGSLLYAVGMMAGGWDGVEEGVNAPGFPEGWVVRVEGIQKAL